ncbi:EF-hand [Ascodesmis nigricans]|uniref:Calmodulin n=1 Tax=Ascodesmis nigricans TaxID=341454 RepID=A0A4S2N1T5_9PEZI|nr:EF-hand [Ascodesmis nigricans]
MPPKRTTRKPQPTSNSKKSKKSQKNDLDLTPEEEAEIREAWNMFAGSAREDDEAEEDEDADRDVIRRQDVRRVLIALGLESTREELQDILETVDPEDEGIVQWPRFLEVAALKIQYRDTQEEVEKAFKLFTGGGDGPIRLQDLRRIADELKDNVTDEQLRDMLEEASSKGIGRGVDLTLRRL